MKNEGKKETEKMSRQEYNKLYYQKNKERLAAKKKETVTVEAPKSAPEVRPVVLEAPKALWGFFRWIELLALISLAVVMTFFLLKESAGFYLDAQEGPLNAYLKAGMIEGIAILFSFSKGKSSFLRWSQRIVVVLLCSLTLWTMSGKLVRSAVQDTSKNRTLAQSIQVLEAELAQKESLRKELINRGWLGATRKYEKGVDQVRMKLVSAHETMGTLQAPQMVINTLIMLIAFRLLIVVSNLICFHRLAEQISLAKVHRPGLWTD